MAWRLAIWVSLWVRMVSSPEGVGSPEGWLWIQIIYEAERR